MTGYAEVIPVNQTALLSGRRRRDCALASVRRQTARAVFPHAAFTKTRDLRCKETATAKWPCLHPEG
jgi:hypothetical protein